MDNTIRLLSQEVTELLPWLNKQDKKQLQKQHEAGRPLGNDKPTPLKQLQRGQQASSSNINPHAIEALDATMPVRDRKLKAQLQAELETWRRDLYMKGLDRHSKLRPSGCAPPQGGLGIMST